MEESRGRLSAVVQRELADEAYHGGHGHSVSDAPGTAAKGVLHESATICGNAFDAILTLSEAQRVRLMCWWLRRPSRWTRAFGRTPKPSWCTRWTTGSEILI